MHIIINRIALIMYDGRKVIRLKWAVALILGMVNVSVFIVWMPARLQISPAWIHFNEIWDRVEKGIFALIDLGLNLYFIYLVRSELVARKQLLDTISTPSRSTFYQMWPVPQRTNHTAGFETGYGHIVTLSSPNLYETTTLVL